MWQLKTSTNPIVVDDALGLVKKGIVKHIEKIPGKKKTSRSTKNSTY